MKMTPAPKLSDPSAVWEFTISRMAVCAGIARGRTPNAAARQAVRDGIAQLKKRARLAGVLGSAALLLLGVGCATSKPLTWQPMVLQTAVDLGVGAALGNNPDSIPVVAKVADAVCAAANTTNATQTTVAAALNSKEPYDERTRLILGIAINALNVIAYAVPPEQFQPYARALCLGLQGALAWATPNPVPTGLPTGPPPARSNSKFPQIP
jgi:hypothetical protein